ncbi:MAG: sialate O-acetylesterase [Polaribacter sp.]|jgi:sialate O-acetylesterase
MNKSKILIILISFFFANEIIAQEWRDMYKETNFERYEDANKKLGPLSAGENRVVFMGNSITDFWPVKSPSFFENSSYIGRGISGQTTPQMLLRFRNDVIDLQPKVVVILAGINDIAGNTGYTPIENIAENIKSMAELATQHDIKVVICSVLPALDFPWSPDLEPAAKVVELNKILENYAKQNNLFYVDYHSAMKDENNGLKVPEYTTAGDLVHPNEAGYMAMEKLVQPAIDEALSFYTVSVNKLFTDHMVLQQKEKVAVWGKAPSGDHIVITGSWGDKGTATTDANGNWTTHLNTPEAGGPYELNITATSGTIQINDVLIGEVWLASGQSNMQMPLKGWPPGDPIKDSEQEIANAKYPNIRMFTVAPNYNMKEDISLEGIWEVCTPTAAADYSATAYFFAKRLYQELNIPIGIIHSSWGGTPAESWISKKQIKTFSDFEEIIAAIEDPTREKTNNDWFSKWEKMPLPKSQAAWNDIDLGHMEMAQPAYVERNWSTMELPGRLDLYEGRDVDGAFWFRKTIDLDDISTDYAFEMGPSDDGDVVFFNGEKIGGTFGNYADNRNYPISKSLLKKGKNTIAIRIIDTGGPGSIGWDIKLTNEKNATISLKGKWNYTITAEIFNGDIYTYDMDKLRLKERPYIVYPSPFATPSTLYNGMIHPLAPYTFKGAIWYQGEANVGRADQYERLFPALVKDWRTKWNSDFPFYFVQIAPYRYNNSGNENLDESQELRDAQRRTLSLNKTGMVVTLDIGNNANIHPANKPDVGARLAGLALANDYGKKIVASGPLFKNFSIKRKKIAIEFDQVGTGLMIKGSTLTGFEIAGADKKYVIADAEIVGNKIKVCASSISKPKYVRYAWRDTSGASLFNKEGLPASSFTTEDL